MSLNAVLWACGIVFFALIGAVVCSFALALRQEDEGERLFAELSHDEYGPPPARCDGHARKDGGILTPVLYPAAVAVAALRAHTELAIVSDAQQGPFQRWESDTFVGSLPPMTPEQIARLEAQYAESGEVP